MPALAGGGAEGRPVLMLVWTCWGGRRDFLLHINLPPGLSGVCEGTKHNMTEADREPTESTSHTDRSAESSKSRCYGIYFVFFLYLVPVLRTSHVCLTLLY